uniref:Uncharacterized protein n=1 Tax=Hucho hucho TaxID=62062 RepID=A0A4W5M5D5_9TELE
MYKRLNVLTSTILKSVIPVSSLQDNEKRTPLHAAAYLGDTEILELLILSGARVNAKDNKWLTPLHRAVASCSEVRVLILSADTHTPVHMCLTVKCVVIFKCTFKQS